MTKEKFLEHLHAKHFLSSKRLDELKEKYFYQRVFVSLNKGGSITFQIIFKIDDEYYLSLLKERYFIGDWCHTWVLNKNSFQPTAIRVKYENNIWIPLEERGKSK